MKKLTEKNQRAQVWSHMTDIDHEIFNQTVRIAFVAHAPMYFTVRVRLRRAHLIDAQIMNRYEHVKAAHKRLMGNAVWYMSNDYHLA